MMMNNKQVGRHIKELKRLRQEWIDILVKSPDGNLACNHILSINAKIELLRAFWNFNEEEDMP